MTLDDWRRRRDRLFRAVFADHVGASLFLGALAFTAFYWRVGFFINDNWAIANAMVGVGDGQLAYTRNVYGGDSWAAPGTYVADGNLCGRNYGHVFLSLPALWALEFLSAVADLRIALAGCWSLLLLALSAAVGTVLDRRGAFVALGSAVALVAFAANAAVATPLDERWIPLLALQVTTMVAAALVAVVLYRTFCLFGDRRTGAFVGAVAVIAAPVGFWASIPKRHAVTALFAATALAAFAAGRDADDDRVSLACRVASYAVVGLTAWVHAAEGLILLVALLPADLLTARSNDRRSLAAVGVGLALSLVPFLLTNLAISGDPFRPPRLLRGYGGETELLADRYVDGGDSAAGGTDSSDGGDSAAGGSGSSDGGGVSGGAGGDGSFSLPSLTVLTDLLLSLSDSLFRRLSRFERYLNAGKAVLLEEPERLYHTFVRSGRVPGLRYGLEDQESVNLTVLESAPVLGALAGLPAVAYRSVSGSSLAHPRDWSAERQTDLFAVGYVALFTLFNMPRLPIHAQVTVRYLVPIVPFLLYGVGRVPAVGRVLRTAPRTFAWTYAGLVLIGGQLAVVALRVLEPSLGEAMQLFAVANLAAAAAVAAWLLADATVSRADDRVGAVALAGTAAAGTLFLLLTGLATLSYGDHALPLAGALAGVIG